MVMPMNELTRYGNYEDIVARIENYEGGIENFSLGFQQMGCHVEEDNTFVIREWAPNAQVHFGLFLQLSAFMSELITIWAP